MLPQLTKDLLPSTRSRPAIRSALHTGLMNVILLHLRILYIYNYIQYYRFVNRKYTESAEKFLLCFSFTNTGEIQEVTDVGNVLLQTGISSYPKKVKPYKRQLIQTHWEDIYYETENDYYILYDGFTSLLMGGKSDEEKAVDFSFIADINLLVPPEEYYYSTDQNKDGMYSYGQNKAMYRMNIRKGTSVPGNSPTVRYDNDGYRILHNEQETDAVIPIEEESVKNEIAFILWLMIKDREKM